MFQITKEAADLRRDDDHPDKEYFFQVSKHDIIDASSEQCRCRNQQEHPETMILGRLMNYETEYRNVPGRRGCNVKPVKRSICGEDHILFITKRDVEAMEELRYDYGGCTAADFAGKAV
jgi:hypothetical protein